MAAAHSDYNLEIMIIGDSNVGKLQILNRYTKNRFASGGELMNGECQYSCRYV